MNQKIKAFHNKTQIKQKYITRLEEHQKLDEIIKGRYWENGKGCAVGCTVHSANHNEYESELGIPEWIARLEDTLFEGMPNKNAKEFPLRLLKSIPLGFENWQHIYHQLCVFNLEKICKNTDDEIVVESICNIITLHKAESKDESAWSAARSAARSAWSAAESAWSAARSEWSAAESEWSAAESAWSAAESARSAARSAWSAAESAWSAAESARSAAESARSAAESAWSAARSAARSAAESARSAAYYEISEELIRLLENEK